MSKHRLGFFAGRRGRLTQPMQSMPAEVNAEALRSGQHAAKRVVSGRKVVNLAACSQSSQHGRVAGAFRSGRDLAAGKFPHPLSWLRPVFGRPVSPAPNREQLCCTALRSCMGRNSAPMPSHRMATHASLHVALRLHFTTEYMAQALRSTPIPRHGRRRALTAWEWAPASACFRDIGGMGASWRGEVGYVGAPCVHAACWAGWACLPATSLGTGNGHRTFLGYIHDGTVALLSQPFQPRRLLAGTLTLRHAWHAGTAGVRP